MKNYTLRPDTFTLELSFTLSGMMPSTLEQLEAVEVVYESMPGWNTSIAHCRHFDELPKEAQK